MKNLLKSIVAITAISTLASAAFAGPKAKTMICPFCKMKMTTVKSKAAPIAVKLKTGTFYCCATCHPAPKKK